MKMKKLQLCILITVLIAVTGLGFFLFTSPASKNLFFNARADRLQEQGRYEDAIIMYERLIDVDPDNGVNYWNMAVAYLQTGDEVNAQKQVLVLHQMNEKDLSVMLEDLIERYHNKFSAVQ